MDTTTLVKQVQDYAHQNYTKGWDVVIETLTDEELAEIIAPAATLLGAKRLVSRHLCLSVRKERQADAKSHRDAAGDGLDDLRRMLSF